MNDSRGFSLVEVIAALGVLAVAVVGLLALLAPALRSGREVADRRVAQRIVATVERELRLHARRDFAEFDAFAAATATPVRLVATDDGATVELETRTTLAPAAQFHRIEVSRAASPAFVVGSGNVVLLIRVSWPYRGGVVVEENRANWSVPCALSP